MDSLAPEPDKTVHRSILGSTTVLIDTGASELPSRALKADTTPQLRALSHGLQRLELERAVRPALRRAAAGWPPEAASSTLDKQIDSVIWLVIADRWTLTNKRLGMRAGESAGETEHI